ncbi:TIGR03862 family flavoprotein, partial [Zavarzinia sp.]|uniref:TIGR03862 family flavoprotein n=1 Tax=Zavarzinia sp. TaxID=2027920 RepID=UPI003BB51266
MNRPGDFPARATARAMVVGGGPAGLMAAETLLDAGFAVDLHDSMPSLGRKFLMAGKSGLNISNAEPIESLLGRYGSARPRLEDAIRAFGPAEIVAFAAGLGIETFTGSSGRIFPTGFKAAPLLRAWLRRLRARGLKIHVRHRWRGFGPDGTFLFETPDGPLAVERPAVTVLALGGASWPALGSDGVWSPLLAARGIATRDFAATNCGFDVAWSDIFRERFAGQPVKPVAVRFGDHEIRGEFVVTATGIEGGAIYPLAASARRALDEGRPAVLHLDLMPGRDEASLVAALSKPRGRHSLTDHLRRCLGLS